MHIHTLTACIRGRDLSKVISETDDERVALADERVALAPASSTVPSFSVSSSSTIMMHYSHTIKESILKNNFTPHSESPIVQQ